ncbi:hypothetical protein VDG1235_1954 [Verrucomicrobiia bacterium DG1235]|nr:hypothetical protein VDG1235_1954 [Verrucomicrobiae bacterium DG1235]
MELKGKRIVVTGGTSGVGRALVEELARENELLVIARGSERLAELGACYGNVDTLACDLSDMEDSREIDRSAGRFGDVGGSREGEDLGEGGGSGVDRVFGGGTSGNEYREGSTAGGDFSDLAGAGLSDFAGCVSEVRVE